MCDLPEDRKCWPRCIGPFEIDSVVNRAHETQVSSSKYSSGVPHLPAQSSCLRCSESSVLRRYLFLLHSWLMASGNIFDCRRRFRVVRYLFDCVDYDPKEHSWIPYSWILNPSVLPDFHSLHPLKRDRPPRGVHWRGGGGWEYYHVCALRRFLFFSSVPECVLLGGSSCDAPVTCCNQRVFAAAEAAQDVSLRFCYYSGLFDPFLDLCHSVRVWTFCPCVSLQALFFFVLCYSLYFWFLVILGLFKFRVIEICHFLFCFLGVKKFLAICKHSKKTFK